MDFRKIRIWIVGLEGEHADHLTTTSAQFTTFLRYVCMPEPQNICLAVKQADIVVVVADIVMVGKLFRKQ